MSERRARPILRVAAAVAALQAATHSILFLWSQPDPSSRLWPMVEAMQAQIVGPTNYWQMYFGYGLRDALGEAVIAVFIALAASFDLGSRALARRLVGFLIFAVLAYAVLGALYFFRLPLVFYAALTALLVPGWWELRSGEKRGPAGASGAGAIRRVPAA
jgi:hypothetical protein